MAMAHSSGKKALNDTCLPNATTGLNLHIIQNQTAHCAMKSSRT